MHFLKIICIENTTEFHSLCIVKWIHSIRSRSPKLNGLAKIRWPFHFKWCYINVTLYSNNQLWWYIVHCRDKKIGFPVIYNIIMLHVFIYVYLKNKGTKNCLFGLLCCCTYFFYKLEFVFVHFISIMYIKIDILHYWEIIKLHSIFYRFEIFEFLLKLCLNMCTPPFVMKMSLFEFCNIWPHLLQ